MTRIDFYLLSSADAHSRRVTACRLIEKAFRQGHKVYFRAGSEQEARILDDLLWTFRQGSFVPHELYDPALDQRETPVLIGHGAAPAGWNGVLVNLGDDVPEGYARFERLAELIDQDEAVKQAGRVRYKAYKDAGYAPETHKLDGGASG
jgi:DNA polymerase-3 subunit chi